MNEPRASSAIREPHLCAAWFDLLARTAMPPGTRFDTLRLPSARGEETALRMMRLPQSPGIQEGLANFYSPIYGTLDDHAPDIDALHRVLADLRRRPDAPVVLDFSPLDTDGPCFHPLLAALKTAGWLRDDYFRFGNWFAPIAPGGFATYLAARPSRLRHTLERSERKLARHGDIHLERICAPGPALETAIDDFTAVYEQSWKRTEPWPRFIPELCTLAADQGWLRLGVMKHGSRPIAAQLWLVAGGRAQIVKLAHVPDWKVGSIGSVLTAYMARHAIGEDGVDEIDYLIGDDAYKRDWMPLRRERRGIVAFNPTHPRGLAAALRHFGGQLLRRLRSDKAA